MKRLRLNFHLLLIACIIISCNNNNHIVEAQVAKITYPTGGDVFVSGGILTIEWTDNISNDVRIKLYKGINRLLNITESAQNTGRFNWTIPDGIDNGNDYRIKIFSNTDDFVFYESKEFKILGKGGVSEFTDLRDNQVYKTVKIGNQWWFAQNFNYKTPSGSWADNYIGNSDNWGLYYDWQTAMSICPDGWHLPTDEDWKALELFIGIKTTEINREGARGRYEGLLLLENGGLDFDVKFAGYFNHDYNAFYNSWIESNFWTSTKYYSNSAWIRRFSFNSGAINRTKVAVEHGLSVRYCKNI